MDSLFAGNPHARVGRGSTRSPSSLPRARWTLIAVAVVLVAGAHRAPAQDEEAPEYAVQAPLAAHSLALDAVAVDGALVAVGHRGHILISSDGGDTWEQAEVPTRATLTGVDFYDRNLGWVAGHDSVILRTKDGGVTWERVHWAPEDEAPLFDIWFADADNGIAIGAYGSYYTTSDGGTTWDSEPIGDSDWHLHQIARSADGRMYIAAEAGTAYRSDDGGATWSDLPSPYGGSFFGVLPLEDDVVLLFGLRGHLFRSEDAGESWEGIETGTVAMLTDGIRLPDDRILITGLGGTLLVSEDGGRSFELQEQASRRGIQAAVVASDDSLLLVGEFGVRMLPMNELKRKGSVAP
ncbi:MAG: WD40/YVTN/BNR-like repeat-containing protein [Thermoanaerobaculales bacterium]